jgi:diguanylate cyclase (GGDEF)-like protein
MDSPRSSLIRFDEALKTRSAAARARSEAAQAAQGGSRVADLIRLGALTMVYQPIVDLATAGIHAHEALVRGPEASPLRMPDALFKAARQERVETALERACVALAIARYPVQASGKVFVNLSARVLIDQLETMAPEEPPTWLQRADLAATSIVIEITEHEHIDRPDLLLAAVRRLRLIGIRIALDDFGDGRSSLRLWSELRPDYVKIDKYFAAGISSNGDKLATYRALIQIAEVFGSTIVAEGLECAEDLTVVRDLGIAYGQGWFVGLPRPDPLDEPAPNVVQAIRNRRIAVFPERTRVADHGETIDKLLLPVPPVPPELSNDELFRMFRADESLRSVAIVDQGRTVGLVNRQRFMDRYAKPFHRELYGRKPCTLFANVQPLMLDRGTSIDELTSVLTSEDQRYLTDGYVVTEMGQYAGLGTGESLVRSVTERRIEAARHASPLTLLPGNIPITTHIQRLLGSRSEFVACYCDLDSFKPFNDKYGYWRGDQMIQLAARVAASHCDPRRDFIGHVGGDDFVLLMQSDDWEERCRRIVREFDAQAVQLFDEDARQRGGIEAEDRHGVIRFFPFTKMSIGVVRVEPGSPLRAEDVASAAARAKHEAKVRKAGVYVEA